MGKEKHEEKENMKKEFLSNEMMHGYYSSIIRDMTRLSYTPDLIVAPMRGGADIGVKFSHYFNVPFISLEWQTRDGETKDSAKLRQILRDYDTADILIVDDICDTGDTLREIDTCVDRHIEMEIFKGTVNTAVAIFKESSEFDVTWHARTIFHNEEEDGVWFVFPWEAWWTQN